jgi:sugar/nucleoside kinase (ribokinase family)
VTLREVVDPTGAGDGFTAGFLAGLLRDETPENSARLGAVVASYVLKQSAARPTCRPGGPSPHAMNSIRELPGMNERANIVS